MEDNMKDEEQNFTSYNDYDSQSFDDAEEIAAKTEKIQPISDNIIANDDDVKEVENVPESDFISDSDSETMEKITDSDTDDTVVDDTIEKKSDDVESESVEEVPNDINGEYQESNNTTSSENSADNKKAKKKDKKQKKDKGAKKPKKPLTKVQKIFILIAVGIVIAGIIAASIAIPITIANKDKIFVSKASDFNDTNGKYYVLQNDIHVDGDLRLNTVTNIDFNGKKLIVDGDIYITPLNSGDILLGKRTKNGYVKDGYIEAKDMIINSSESAITIGADLMIDSITIKAKTVNIIASVTATEESSITANSICIDDTFRFSTTKDNAYLNLFDALTIEIKKEIVGNLNIKNSGVKPESGYLTTATINGTVRGNIYADDLCEIIIYSHIEGLIDSNVKDDDGNIVGNIGKIKVLGNAAVVKEINNASLVYIDENVIKRIMPELVNVTNFDIIRQLLRVPYININDDTDTVIMEFGKVNSADKYIISIDGTQIDTVTTTSVDITNYVKGIKSHLISVKAISESNPELLLPSEEIRYEYRTFLTLARPYDIKVTNADSQYSLSFSRVSFADEYIITINGETFNSTETTVDITKYLNKGAGDYIIEIVASSRNENIKSSKTSVYQYSIVQTLNSPNFTIQFNQSDRTFIFSWETVENADVYEIVRMNGDVEESTIYRTHNTSIIISMDDTRLDVKSGQRFKIIAKSTNSYYNPSASQIVTVPFN